MIFLYCIYCGNHLYQTITFETIFKLDYVIHKKCENLLHHGQDYYTVPFLDKMLYIDYLFEERSEDSNESQLFLKYGYMIFDRLLLSNQWSVVLDTTEKIDSNTLVLVLKLSERGVLLYSTFHENFLKEDENTH